MSGKRYLEGRAVVVTGATSGIGRAVAEQTAALGARVIVVGRDPSRASEVVAAIEREHGAGRAEAVVCDFASFASVRGAADELCARVPSIDVLVNNAGTISPKRVITADGHELTFQVNHLSPFLLTNLLRPALTSAAPARVVTVSSDAHFYTWRGIRMDDLSFSRGFSPFAAYAHSKLANIMFAYELGRRWAGTGVSSNAVHPGVVRTNFGRDGWGLNGWAWELFVPKLSPEQGADTVVWLASDPSLAGASGRYYFRRRPKNSSGPSYDERAQAALWEYSAQAVGMEEGVGG